MSDQYELQNASIVSSLFQLLDGSGQILSLDEQGQIPVPAPADDLIPLKEWAVQNGLSPATARQKAGRGALKTARKVGRDWMISRYEQNVDHRYKDSLPRLNGPIQIDKVLNYLLLLNTSSLPDTWKSDASHRKYCHSVFFSLRSKLYGNEKILFDLLCDAMTDQPQADVCYIPHDDIISNLRDEAFDDQELDEMDFPDYLLALASVVRNLLSHTIELEMPLRKQTLLLPWYQSVNWTKEKEDGLYFVPSSFFRLIFAGLETEPV